MHRYQGSYARLISWQLKFSVAKCKMETYIENPFLYTYTYIEWWTPSSKFMWKRKGLGLILDSFLKMSIQEWESIVVETRSVASSWRLTKWQEFKFSFRKQTRRHGPIATLPYKGRAFIHLGPVLSSLVRTCSANNVLFCSWLLVVQKVMYVLFFSCLRSELGSSQVNNSSEVCIIISCCNSGYSC